MDNFTLSGWPPILHLDGKPVTEQEARAGREALKAEAPQAEHPGMPFLQYMTAQEERRAAKAELNYASVALERAYIRERLAKLRSQHEPLAGLLASSMPNRDLLYAAAFWVVVGRLPQGEPAAEVKPA